MRLYQTEFDDPYGDLLNVNRPVETEAVQQMINTWSIDAQKEAGLPLVRTKINSDRPKKPWEHWDPFMEREFGDMDAELTEDQKWMYEARDVVELKRGFAIWSKRSDKDLQRELRKTLATKSLNVPENVAMIIRAVYLEKTHTMRFMRASKDHEMACIDFRKWMIQQKQKSKKDPLPTAKVEVSKKWLLRAPSASLGYERNQAKPPPVVMDEQSLPTYPVNITPGGSVFGWAESGSTMGGTAGRADGPTAAGGSVSGVVGSTSSGQSHVVTSSMTHWNAGKAELPESMIGDRSEGAGGEAGAAGRVSEGRTGVFYVDGELLFTPSALVALSAQRVQGEAEGANGGGGGGREQMTGAGANGRPDLTPPTPSTPPDEEAIATEDFCDLYVVL